MPKLTEQELEQMYDEALNEHGDRDGLIQVAGYKYEVARILKEVDPIAYNVGKHDFADFLLGDGYEIEGY